MAARSLEERIAQLEARKKALQGRLGKRERANDTRRKILIGALVIHRMERGHDEVSIKLANWLRRELPGFITRDHDREILADLMKPATDQPAPKVGA